MILDKKKIFYGLFAVVLFQFAVLVMEYGNAVYPLLTGQEIKLKVIPVDPRSLFRGNYARLRYEINRVDCFECSRTPRQNEIVYVKLKQDADGIYKEVGASLLKPDTGIFIRGRAQESRTGNLSVRYGIEAFFAPKEKAMDLENKLRSEGVAIVMLAKNGKPALKDVVTK